MYQWGVPIPFYHKPQKTYSFTKHSVQNNNTNDENAALELSTRRMLHYIMFSLEVDYTDSSILNAGSFCLTAVSNSDCLNSGT